MQYLFKHLTIFVVLASAVLSGCGSSGGAPASVAAEPSPAPQPSAPTAEQSSDGAGYKSVFIGHSFFIPIANEIPEHAQRLGIDNHSQFAEFSGGATGAPMALWNDEVHRANIQAALDAGDVELFAMTFEPNYSSTDGYILWIDYALSRNPNTKIVLGLPWVDLPGEYENAAEYAQTFKILHDDLWSNLVETLRVMYPGVKIISMPYGAAAAELRTLFEAGELPGITALGSSDPNASIFRDEKGHGHADGILLTLSELIWLATIYDVDMNSYDFDAGFEVNLKALAKKITDDYDSDSLCCVVPL